MPHIIVDYSPNLEDAADIARLCQTLRAAAARHPALPMPGIRVRAHPAYHVAIADGDGGHAYIHVTLRLREGRSHEEKTSAAHALFDALRDFCEPLLADRSLALSLEVVDIEAAHAPRAGNIRKYLVNVE